MFVLSKKMAHISMAKYKYNEEMCTSNRGKEGYLEDWLACLEKEDAFGLNQVYCNGEMFEAKEDPSEWFHLGRVKRRISVFAFLNRGIEI